MLIRILFIIISLLIFTQSAPSPYFTRSFVQTPSSTYEQYLIVPDKSDAYRVPMSQVHHYSDFQFPKQQVVYYNPSTGTNQHRLQALKKDNPLWQQMLMNLHGKPDENMLMNDDAEMTKMSETMEMNENSDQKVMNEDTMRMILDQENPSSDMMEKLKREDTKIGEIMKILEEPTTLTPKVLTQPIDVASDDDINKMSDQTEQINSENNDQDSPSDQNDSEIELNMMEPAGNLTDQILQVSPQIHPEMTRVIISESILPEIQNEDLFKTLENEQSTDFEAANEIQTETPILSRIAELISNVEPLEISTIMNQVMNQDDIQASSTTEQTPLRRSKEFTLEIMRNIKDHPEIMIKLVELAAASIQEMESDLRSDSIENEERLTEQNIAVTEPPRMETTESTESLSTEEAQSNILESSTINPSNSNESTQLSTDSPNSKIVLETSESDNENPFSTEKLIAELETSTEFSSEPSMSPIQLRIEDSMTSTEKSEPELENSSELSLLKESEVDQDKEKVEESTTTQIPMLNIIETTASDESLNENDEPRAELLVLTENIVESTQTADSSDLLQSTTEALRLEPTESSTELEQQEMIQSSTESELIESSSTTEAVKLINDESTEAIKIPATESIILQESSSTESSGMIQELRIVQISMTSRTNNSDQVNPTMTENIEQSVTRSDIPLNAIDSESNEDKITSSEEQLSSDSSERESESQEEQVTMQETPQSESGETMREGRVNKAPTMFLHNNRFYVISGVPEFYANFDAYQNPRTPIFSLQELQPIKPMNNVAIQNIEPFRIYVEDNEEQKSSTQDDNEPFKMQNNTRDNPRSDIENTQSMNMEQREPEMQREMTVKVKKRVQERQPASEGQYQLQYFYILRYLNKSLLDPQLPPSFHRFPL